MACPSIDPVHLHDRMPLGNLVRIAQQRRSRQSRLSSVTAADLDRRLYDAFIQLSDFYSSRPITIHSVMLSRIRRLIRSGASTSCFSDHELRGGPNIADLIHDKFLPKDLTRRPDRDLFKLVWLLVSAGPAAVTNRSYVGNGGQDSAAFIETFLMCWCYPATERNARIMYGQCVRLLQLIYVQLIVYEVPPKPWSQPCRYCELLNLPCNSRWSHAAPMPDYIADFIVSFLRLDLVSYGITGTVPKVDDCVDQHAWLSWSFKRCDDKVFRRIMDLQVLFVPIMDLLASSFFNVVHRSKESRRLFRAILHNDFVADFFRRNTSLISELIRRKDRRSLEVLLPRMSPRLATASLRADFAQVRGRKERIGNLLSTYMLI